MTIRRAIPTDRDALLGIWLRAVRATHTFLTEDDVQFYLPLVRDGFASAEAEFWVLASDAGAAIGYLELSGSKIEALFIDPAFHGQGGGRLLVEHAKSLAPNLTVDVNEQNPAACRFYEACGFVEEGRSELDGTGRPFPILHMRLVSSGVST